MQLSEFEDAVWQQVHLQSQLPPMDIESVPILNNW
ncbi:hypothetical protein LMG29739_04324 [Paraburkholderia solisilvae]|uniref:Uncharacterized protein n=1 Tax=Paraburkholderia solisilvae TaxID=624376 RepID=A0A6J5ECS4_9BURK|nr:hypothetical protein LMG29739_04324 [Paraburkholderia solisilvae]